MSPQALTAGILAGGQSSRFGSDKAFAPIDGEPVIARLVRGLRQQGLEVIISARPPQERYAGLDCLLTLDQLGAGPLAGVHSLLAATRTEWLLLLPVDVVALPRDWVAQWSAALAASPGAPALVLHANAHWQPTYCLLRQSLVAAAAQALAAGRLGLGAWLRTIGARPFDHVLPPGFNSRSELDDALGQCASPMSSGA